MLVFSLFSLIQVVGHTILASVLWNRAKSVDLKSKDAITSFYMFIWKVTLAFILSKIQTLLFVLVEKALCMLDYRNRIILILCAFAIHLEMLSNIILGYQHFLSRPHFSIMNSTGIGLAKGENYRSLVATCYIHKTKCYPNYIVIN